jgi:hypothetical protein
MAKCYPCGAETKLHSFGLPVCVKCLENQEQTIKQAIAQRFGDGSAFGTNQQSPQAETTTVHD